MYEALATAPDEVFDRLLASARARASEGPRYDLEVQRIREGRDAAWDEGLAQLVKGHVPLVKGERVKAMRPRRYATPAEAAEVAALREGGVPVDDAVDERPVMLEELAKGMQAAIDRTSPIPLTLPVGDDGLPDVEDLRTAMDDAQDLADEERARVTESVGLAESAKQIREASANRRRQAGTGRGSG